MESSALPFFAYFAYFAVQELPPFCVRFQEDEAKPETNPKHQKENDQNYVGQVGMPVGLVKSDAEAPFGTVSEIRYPKTETRE